MYCPNCGAEHLVQFEANRPVADFYCDSCRQEFELKSKMANSIGGSITDGAYTTMIQRITSNNNPNLFYLTHDDAAINNLIFIPRYFFTPSIIEKRAPLKETARRAGWTGCNINISCLPKESMIYIVRAGIVSEREKIISDYNKIKSLQFDDMESRGWIMDVLFCINNIPDDTFGIDDMYAFEPYLHEKHPNNQFIRAKIRQQLQVLRDKGYIRFVARGVYQKV
jgi:type II restriction enzyme